MRNIFLFVLYYYISDSSVFAQQKVIVHVKASDGNPISGVTAYTLPQKKYLVSDEHGRFIWTLLKIKDTLHLEELNYEIAHLVLDGLQEEIEITLQRKQHTMKAAEIISSWTKPRSIIVHSTLNATELARKSMIQDVPYIIQNLPSSVSTSDAGNGVGYTGIRIRGLDPTQINVLINGVPLNDAESQSVFWVDLPDLIASASEIQVQRGIGLSGAGQVAFGSSLLINTNRLNAKPYLTADMAAGSYNTNKASISLGSGLFNKNWNIQGRVSKVHSDGYIDRASTDLWSGYLSISKITGDRSLRLHLFDGLEKTYQAWYGVPVQFVRSNRTYNAAGTEKSDSPYSNQIDRYRQTHFQFIHHENLNRSWNIQNTVHYTPGKGYYEEYKADQMPSDYLLNGASSIPIIRRRNLINNFVGSIHSAHFANARMDIQFGTAWNRYAGRHVGEVIQVGAKVLSTPSKYYDRLATKWSSMAFGKVEYNFNTFQIIGDMQLRIVKYNYQPESASIIDYSKIIHRFLSPKLGMTWQINSRLQLFAFSGVAYREPNREDYIKADKLLPKAERVWDHEVGGRWRTTSFSMEQNFYGMVYKNQLIPTGKLNDVGAYIRSNIPSSYRLGSETSLSWTPNPSLTINANVNISRNRTLSFIEYIDNWDKGIQEGRIWNNRPIAFSPGQIFNISLYNVLLNRTYYSNHHLIAVESNFRAIGNQYVDGTGVEYSKLQGYHLLDGTLYYTFQRKGKTLFDLRFQCNNLLDKKYSSNGWIYRFKSPSYNPVPDDPYAASEENNTYHLKGLFPQAGRNGMLGIRIYFGANE